jgi:hypothetical protein
MKVTIKCGDCKADLGTFVVSGKEADVEVHACEHCDKLTFTLVCDPQDYAAIRDAIARRSEYPVPESASGYNGARIAEICRGYLGMLGEKE